MIERGDQRRRPGSTSSGPSPIPSRWSSDGRGRDAVPLADVADEQDLARGAWTARASRRPPAGAAHHGAMTSANSATAPSGGRERDRPGAPARPADRHASASGPTAKATPSDDQHQHAVVARERREAGQQARPARTTAAVPSQPARRQPQRAGDQRLVEREVVRLGHVDEATAPAAPSGRPRRLPRTDGAPASRAIAQVSGAASAPMSANGSGGRASAVGPSSQMNGTWTMRRQRHPVRVRRDRQGRVGRDRAADLGEDPDEVDVEAVAPRASSPGDVDVVGRVRVGRVREVPR